MSAVDFTSANYLGYRHDRLPPWRELTTGRPPALGEPRAAGRLATDLAARAGRPAGVLYASTLHAFVDGWAMLDRPLLPIVDECAYATGRIGLRANGLTATVVRHFDPAHLAAVVRRCRPAGRRPVLLVDGLCPGCGRLAPLDAYVSVLAGCGGLVLVDDTQAAGLAGWRGGGSAAGLSSAAPVVVVASLAKGYGAPLAALSGPADLVARVRADGPLRVHGSGPSAAALAALGGALADGDRREPVRKLVALFRDGLRRHGLPEPDGGDWPMQTIPLPDALTVRDALLDKGIRTVAVHRRCRPGIGLAFLITARHTPADLERATSALVETL